jgi:hypothetical protein
MERRPRGPRRPLNGAAASRPRSGVACRAVRQQQRGSGWTGQNDSRNFVSSLTNFTRRLVRGPDLGRVGYELGRALIESGAHDSDIAEFGRFPEALPHFKVAECVGHGADLAHSQHVVRSVARLQASTWGGTPLPATPPLPRTDGLHLTARVSRRSSWRLVSPAAGAPTAWQKHCRPFRSLPRSKRS